MKLKALLRKHLSRENLEVIQAIQAMIISPITYLRLLIRDFTGNPINKRPQNFQKLRFALIKQEIYTNLYCNTSCFENLPELIRSSLKHTGPLALFTEFDCTFYIVKEDASPECQTWREKIWHCGQGTESDFYKYRDEVFEDGNFGHSASQGSLAVPSEEVDWSAFDVVISVDICVPARITQNYRRTLWCYYISEPCMPSYLTSRDQPLKGYDIFLNQRFQPTYPRRLSLHELDFPFALQNEGCVARALEISIRDDQRTGIFLEYHTALHLTAIQKSSLGELGPLRIATGSTSEILDALCLSKYFLKLGGRRVWGNAMPEAIAAGCVVIGQPGEFKNASLFSRRSMVFTFSQAVDRIKTLEACPRKYAALRAEQNALLNWFCFARPLSSLLARHAAKIQAFSMD